MRAVSNKRINQRLGKLRDPFDPESFLGFCIRHMSSLPAWLSFYLAGTRAVSFDMLG
jgi:hypothetical protein